MNFLNACGQAVGSIIDRNDNFAATYGFNLATTDSL
jgi:hypothetical protein